MRRCNNPAHWATGRHRFDGGACGASRRASKNPLIRGEWYGKFFENYVQSEADAIKEAQRMAKRGMAFRGVHVVDDSKERKQIWPVGEGKYDNPCPQSNPKCQSGGPGGCRLATRRPNPLTRDEAARSLRVAADSASAGTDLWQMGLPSRASGYYGFAKGVTGMVREFGPSPESGYAAAQYQHYEDQLRQVEEGHPPVRGNPRPRSLSIDIGGPRAQYVRYRYADPAAFDPRSLRTYPREDDFSPRAMALRKKGIKLIVGCPRGQWDPTATYKGRKGRCLVGTRMQAMLRPKTRAEVTKAKRAGVPVVAANSGRANPLRHGWSRISSGVFMRRFHHGDAVYDLYAAGSRGHWSWSVVVWPTGGAHHIEAGSGEAASTREAMDRAEATAGMYLSMANPRMTAANPAPFVDVQEPPRRVRNPSLALIGVAGMGNPVEWREGDLRIVKSRGWFVLQEKSGQWFGVASWYDLGNYRDMRSAMEEVARLTRRENPYYLHGTRERAYPVGRGVPKQDSYAPIGQVYVHRKAAEKGRARLGGRVYEVSDAAAKRLRSRLPPTLLPLDVADARREHQRVAAAARQAIRKKRVPTTGEQVSRAVTPAAEKLRAARAPKAEALYLPGQIAANPLTPQEQKDISDLRESYVYTAGNDAFSKQWGWAAHGYGRAEGAARAAEMATKSRALKRSLKAEGDSYYEEARVHAMRVRNPSDIVLKRRPSGGYDVHDTAGRFIGLAQTRKAAEVFITPRRIPIGKAKWKTRVERSPAFGTRRRSGWVAEGGWYTFKGPGAVWLPSGALLDLDSGMIYQEKRVARGHVEVRSNPGRTATLSTVRSWSGYQKAMAASKRFHGATPTQVKLIRIADGKPGITRKVVSGLGLAPTTEYTVPGKRSNKVGAIWRHDNGERGGRKPYLVHDPETDIVSMVGGTLKVTDWLHR